MKQFPRILVPLLLLILLTAIILPVSGTQLPGTVFGGAEKPSPSQWILEENISVFPSKVVIDVKNASWAGFTDTNSMDPFIDTGAHTIEVLPKDPDTINVGDVISYQSDSGIIIHRVIEKGYDENGLYFLVKGDNNNYPDPVKVRSADLKGVVVAVIY